MHILNVHALRTSINRLCEFLDEEYNINSGGCCFIASLLSKHLDNLKVPYSLVAYDYIERDEYCIQYEVSKKVKNKFVRGSVTGIHSCNHYCLYIEGAGEINSGEFENCSRYVIKDIKSSNIQWIYKNGKWNDRYSIDNNKAIKNIIKSFFKQYEKAIFVH